MNRNVTVSMTEGQALAHQVDELSALYRLTDKLYRARSAGDVYEAALDAIRDTLGCSRASVLLFDDAGVMRFVAWRGIVRSISQGGRRPFAMEGRRARSASDLRA